jgi:uncharacterized protein with FMN-binding domain
MTESGSNKGSNKKVANSLVAVSWAAVLAVYAAGYTRTQSAANRLAAQVSERRAAGSDARRSGSPIGEFQPIAPSARDGASPAMTISSNPARGVDAKPSATALPDPKQATAQVSGHAVEASPAELPTPSSLAAPVASPIAPTVTAPVTNQAAEPAAPVTERKPDAPPAAPPPPIWKDGTYTGWGYSRHGNIEAAVVIEGGRIMSATISQCRTRYSCSVIERLPPQVAQRQSPDVDYVSGATQSADAFYGAVVEALSKAK